MINGGGKTIRVKFLGTGQMGLARNLLRAGHELSVYNRTRSRAEPLTAEGTRSWV